MFDLDLQINDYQVKLGNDINIDIIKGVGLKKVGFFYKMFIKINEGENVYWAKNCDISCFGHEFILFPMTNLRTEDFRIMSKLDRICGTTAFLFYKNNILNRLILQCIHSEYWAEKKLDEFREKCEKHFGSPEMKLIDLFAFWEDNDSQIISELSKSGKHSYIHWKIVHDKR